MNRFDSFNRQLSGIFHNLYVGVKGLLKKSAIFLKALQRQSSFLLNKQRILHTIYTPIIQAKVIRSQQLLSELHKIRTEQSAIRRDIASITKQNKNLTAKIKILQELILKK